jgi:demethylspheroidene O-methyltransferase
MSQSQSLFAGDVLDAYPLRGHRCLLDVGGGDGTFVSAVAARWPHLRLLLFDLPAVAARADARFDREGLVDRAKAFGGDLVNDTLPAGADIVSLVRVIHDHDDDDALAILNAVHRALPRRGTLLVAEPMAGTRGAERIGDAYFGFYLLAMGSGRPRTPSEIEALLTTAGFGEVRVIRTRRPLLTGLIVARAV